MKFSNPSPEANIYDALRVLVPSVQFPKNVKNVHGGVLVLVKLQAKASHDSNLQLVKVLSVLYQPSQEICKHFVLQLLNSNFVSYSTFENMFK